MPSIAVVGTGIAGMGAAYFLKDKHDITFYEKNDYSGGHTNTLTVKEPGGDIYIDSGFMVYNEITYPNLTRLFKELDVKTKPTDMSFSVQHLLSALEYCGTGLNGLFAQRKNLVSVSHWKMLLEMNRFNNEALEVLDNDKYLSYSLVDYVKEKGYSDDFLHKFLVPISSAVWSTPQDLMLRFPAVTLVRFFKNHGFLGLRGHYQWRTVVDGSQRYREKILMHFKDKILLNNPVKEVRRHNARAMVIDSRGEKREYDKVILASHADESLRMLAQPTQQESGLLSKFRYHKNVAALHTDESIMPRTKLAWSSWNYRITDKETATIYWMNNLQHVSKQKNYFISINDVKDVDPSKIIWRTEYTHPIYNVDAIQAQKKLHELNKDGVIYFCGAYFKYGFHEDALTSGIDVARVITGEPIWN
ncbi:MAG: FAD-dependent oxidoreductase [Candidatus Omnitrophica bacterium]|nr:FAD-dependent oxidoreductase [Candidatus Omnitrophota bacterium]